MTLRRPFVWTCCLMSLVAFIAAPASFAGEPWTKQENSKVKMPDGIALGTDIYLPEQGETFPVVLVRTPYDKRGKQWLVKVLVPLGYAVVLQDVRGMNASEGVFQPFIHEKADGIATLDWIVDQPWCDGNIGAWGTSYVAYCALVLAPSGHPALKTVINMSGWGDGARLAYPGGAMHLMLMAPWMLSNQIHGKGSFRDYDWTTALQHVPVSEIPASLGVHSVQWEEAMKGSLDDRAMRASMITDQYDKIHIPILHVTGWNDFVGRGTLDVFESLERSDRPDAELQKLVIGPWRHDQIWLNETRVGDEDFGAGARMGIEPVGELIARWFSRWLKGDDNGVTREEPVKLFVMGVNEWRTFDAWPPKKIQFQKWRFASHGHANSLAGDGFLANSEPNGAAPDTFLFDPMNPVPTAGGANFHFFLDNLGVKDQRDIEKRDDVLVYTSEPLAKDSEIIGPLQAVVYASSEGKQTDFTAKLVEVRDDGYARIIEEGIRRGPDPIDGQPVAAMEPGRVYKFTIDLGATAIRIKKGHRVRVELSSSNFPKYSRNPNTGEVAERASKFISVRQRVHHSPEYPSHIALPVMP